jgi:hemolysin III
MAKHRLKDPFSAISHYAGAGAAILGFCYLMFVVWHHTVAVVAFAIYGACLTLLYVASGIYHSVETRSKWLQRLDHMAIYLMIAGTYTPICLLAVRGAVGYAMLAAEWGMALIGISANIFFGGGPKGLRLTLYLLMGWLAVGVVPGLLRVLPASAMVWMLAGGLAFTGGTVIYATGRPKLWPGKFGSHELWHLFVLGGSACHYLLMLSTAHLAQTL